MYIIYKLAIYSQPADMITKYKWKCEQNSIPLTV